MCVAVHGLNTNFISLHNGSVRIRLHYITSLPIYITIPISSLSPTVQSNPTGTHTRKSPEHRERERKQYYFPFTSLSLVFLSSVFPSVSFIHSIRYVMFKPKVAWVYLSSVLQGKEGISLDYFC